MEGGGTVNNIPAAGDDRLPDTISHEHQICFRSRHLHILPINASFDPDYVLLAAFRRRRADGGGKRLKIPASVGGNYDVSRHAALKHPPIR